MVWRTRGLGSVHEKDLHAFIGATDQEQLIDTLCIGYLAEIISIEKKRTIYTEKKTWL